MYGLTGLELGRGKCPIAMRLKPWLYIFRTYPSMRLSQLNSAPQFQRGRRRRRRRRRSVDLIAGVQAEAATLSSPRVRQTRMEHNYATANKIYSGKFINFLHRNSRVYEAQLHGTICMNRKYGTSEPYTLQIAYDQMWQFNAEVDLIVAICNSLASLHVWLLPAGRMFLRENGCVNDGASSNVPCLSFSGFPESMQNLEDFWQNCPLAQHVYVFGGKRSIRVPTVHGRLFIEVFMAALLEKHAQGISRAGSFNSSDMVIIKWSTKFQRRGNKPYEMEIVKKQAEVTKPNLHNSMVKDLQKAAAILMKPFNQDCEFLPVHFQQFKETLEQVKQEFVAEAWFREYLCYHPAILPSIGRRNYEVVLHTIISSCSSSCNMHLIMASEPYPTDWRELVKSAEKDGLDVIHKVYYYNDHPAEQMTDPYENSVRGLIRFKRNVLEHGLRKQSIRYMTHLELSAAERFSKFLPWLVRTLLEQKLMESFGFADAWAALKASQTNRREALV